MISDSGIRDPGGAPTVKSTRKRQTVESAVSGMRRVDCVRMVEDVRPRFFVVGVGHRRPVEREITPTVAMALLEDVPCRYQWHRTANGVN
jgi:hypothetical protein